MGPYAYKGDQWVGFDDIAMIRRKSEFVKANGYGGGMIWALDLDDFTNHCNCEEYPLLRTINRVLRNYPIPDPNCRPLSNSAAVPYGSFTSYQPYSMNQKSRTNSQQTSAVIPYTNSNTQYMTGPFVMPRQDQPLKYVYGQQQSIFPYTGHFSGGGVSPSYSYNIWLQQKWRISILNWV